ncbi:hypothetical protein [Chitinophaga vietnamensis]|uniref:hypothetical protein n=1 Tax=Chitinophaga vietnamensis TaxID=2593957 RepID=UPI0011782B9C|nr:hypothetical protein [Chitinophaga vietnamensis]
MKKKQINQKQRLSLNKIIVANLSAARNVTAPGFNASDGTGNTTVDTHWPTTGIFANDCTTVDTHWPTTASGVR